MSPYPHLTPFEREKLMSLHNNGKGISEIARCPGRHKSTVSRELKRNSFSGCYSSFVAQGAYFIRRKVCHPRRKLDDEETLKRVRELFYFKQSPPEQIDARLKDLKEEKKRFPSALRRSTAALLSARISEASPEPSSTC